MSAPHIYHSALVSTPKTSIVGRLYEAQAHPFVRVVHGAQMSWDPNPAAAILPSAIKLAVWSQCNRFIAIARGNTVTVDILDSSTLQRLQTLESAQDIPIFHGALIFSPDSRVLTCFSDGGCSDETFLISWDLQTGGTVSIIKRQGQKPTMGNPSVTYSMDGKMVGVFYWCRSTSAILIYNVISGVHMHSYWFNSSLVTRNAFFNDGPVSNDIWTHGESLRFVTARAKTIVIWELGFTSGPIPTEIETIPVSGDVESAVLSCNNSTGGLMEQVRFLPTSCRLAIARAEKVLVWDLRNSISLLHNSGTDVKYHPRRSFSSDGRFFACSTTGSEILLWKESPTGYALHGTLTPGTEHSTPLLSPNGESIVAFGGGTTIRLWHTNSFTTPSSISTGNPQHTANFALDFSSNGALAEIGRAHV